MGLFDTPKELRWPPALGAGEVVLVSCSVDARRRVPFHLMVTNERLLYARTGLLGLRVAREVGLASVRHARAQRVRPIGYGILGALLIGLFCLYAWVTWHDPDPAFDWRALALLGFGALAFSAGSNRWKLVLESAGGTIRIVQPGTSREYQRDQMAAALREAALIAADAGERERRTAEVRAAADPDAD